MSNPDTSTERNYKQSALSSRIKEAKPGDIIWDKGEPGSVRGLHVRISPSGQAGFFLYYRAKTGVQRRPKLGTFPELKVNEARVIARNMWSIIGNGGDPSADRKASRGEMTVTELYQLVALDHWSKTRFQESGWGKEAAQNFKNHIKKKFGHKKLSEISPLMVKEWHKSLADKPIAANRSLAVLSKMFSYAEENEIRPLYTNPCRPVKKFGERRRTRFASYTEAKALLQFLTAQAEKRPRGVAFILIMMFTGIRPRMLEKATPDDFVRFEHNGKTYGKLSRHGKTQYVTNEEDLVIFPPQAVAILDKLPPAKDGSLVGTYMPRDLWEKARHVVGCKTLWMRDWRRTFATMALSTGESLDTIAEILNHRSRQTTLIYAKLLDEKRIETVGKVADQFEKLF